MQHYSNLGLCRVSAAFHFLTGLPTSFRVLLIELGGCFWFPLFSVLPYHVPIFPILVDFFVQSVCPLHFPCYFPVVPVVCFPMVAISARFLCTDMKNIAWTPGNSGVRSIFFADP